MKNPEKLVHPLRYEYTYVVEGAGEFPIDMLRYDAAYPARGEDAAGASGPFKETRCVRLKHVGTDPFWKPEVARWQSFGWHVVKDDQT